MLPNYTSRPFWALTRSKLVLAPLLFVITVPLASALFLRGASPTLVLLFVIAVGVLVPPIVLICVQQRRARSRVLPSRGILALVSMISIAVIFSVLTLFGKIEPFRLPDSRYSTRVGEQLTVRLQDGSVAQLNTDSAISVRSSRNALVIHLTRGEIIVSAAYNNLRTLIVTAGDVAIQNNGTRFSVRLRESGGLETVVEYGSVRLLRTSQKIELRASQAAVVRPDAIEVTSLTRSQLHDRLAWRTN